MSYGIQIFNQDGRKQVDSDEIAPNTYLTNVTSSAYTAMAYPPPNYVNGDLVLARAADNPVTVGTGTGAYVPIARGRVINSTQYFYGAKAIQDAGFTYEFANTAGIVTGLVRTQAGNLQTPSPGEYGLDVYSTDGSTILFSATRSTSVKVLATGVLKQNETFTYNCPPELSFTKIYVVVNSTEMVIYPGSFFLPAWAITKYYRFYPNSSPPQVSATNVTLADGQPISDTGSDFTYMIVYDTN